MKERVKIIYYFKNTGNTKELWIYINAFISLYQVRQYLGFTRLTPNLKIILHYRFEKCCVGFMWNESQQNCTSLYCIQINN